MAQIDQRLEWPCSLARHPRPHSLPGQTGSRPANCRLPLADLILMPSEMESFGLAALEGHGLQGNSRNCHARRRRARADHGWRGWLAFSRRRCRCDGRGHRLPCSMTPSGRHVRCEKPLARPRRRASAPREFCRAMSISTSRFVRVADQESLRTRAAGAESGYRRCSGRSIPAYRQAVRSRPASPRPGRETTVKRARVP